MKAANASFEFKTWSKGGSMFPILAGEAEDQSGGNGKFDKAIEYRPDEVYMLIDARVRPGGWQPVERAAAAFQKIGSRVYVVDGVRPFIPVTLDAPLLEKSGIAIVPLRERGVALGLLDQQWEGYDGIHGGTFLHVFYAKEFLKWYAAKESERGGGQGD